MNDRTLDDHLDRLVAEYSDRLAAGGSPDRKAVLDQVPAEARPGLERCLKMVETGSATSTPGFSALGRDVRLGRYVLSRELGRGGMAVVWLAHDEELRRPVALKLLRPGLAFEDRHVERFRREALAVAKLQHPNVVQVYDVGQAGGWHYIAMEYVEGSSLATVFEALANKPRKSADELVQATGAPRLGGASVSFERALAGLCADVADALHAAHTHGLVHRDVKPSNLLLTRDGVVKVADFGLAKSDGDPALSLTGDTLGTPHYMSPEQAWLVETEVDHRSDVYSLGVTLFEGLTGQRPYEGETVLDVFQAIKTRAVPIARTVQPGVSHDASAVIALATSRQRDERYADAAAMAADLRNLAKGLPTEAKSNQGGFWRQLRTAFRHAQMGGEYRSPQTLLGLPLIHFVGGRPYPGARLRVAKGWIASGEIAVGVIAMGGVAAGGVTMGGLSFGTLLGFGGVASGLLAFGGLSLGGLAFGGLATGFIAMGGLALGYAAVGGVARGIYAIGSNAGGRYAWSNEHERFDQEALDWFREYVPYLLKWSWIGNGGPS